MSSLTSAAKSLGENAEFLYKSIFKAQPNAESARRYYAVLRQWAGSGKAYRGRTFTRAEVEEAILAFERDAGSAPEPAPKLESDAKRPMTETPESAKRPKTMNHFWPRWVLDSKSVEVLVPAQGGKPAAWTTATPVGIGYRGQKKHFLFVRSVTFEMDCRRQEVRKLGGRQTVQELLDDMHGNGIDVTSHPEWTDGSDSGSSSRKVVDFVAPGVQPEGMPKEDSFPVPEKPSLVKQASTEMFDELEGDFERMALLQRSRLVKIKTSDHPDPLTEPRATASIKLPQLTENDVLMMTPAQAEKNLSSLQLETCTLAARRFRQTLVDGRASGYVIGDGTGCGKGRCIAALMVHLWNSGCRRNIWVSATNDLYYDAVRDLKDLGADIPCISLRRLPPSAPLDKWGTETNKELFKHFGAEGDGIIFVTYSLLVQTGTRRQLYACPIKTEETRTALLGSDLLDERLRVTRDVSSFSEISDVPLDLHKGDRIVNIQSLKSLQKMTLPFSLTLERVLHKTKNEKAAEVTAADKNKNKCKIDDKTKSKEKNAKAGKDVDSKGGEGVAEDDDLKELTPWNSRLGQLVEWMGGKNATGLICFDEVHKAKNLVPDKDDHASTKTGLYVDILQRSCPKAPILYVSATAATEVKHLGYMGRLGLWGTGTAFEDFQDFAKAMEAGGVSGMEMLAINMKALGAMSCKALAYVGTEFETRVVGLTKEQHQTYDKACAFWMKALDAYEKFTSAKELKAVYGKKFFRNKNVDEFDMTKRVWQFFWGSQQRFFKAMCNAAKVPAAAEIAREAIEAGEQVCMSIWATGESRSQARMSRLKDETPGRIIIEEFSEGSLVKVTIADEAIRKKVVSQLYSNMRLRVDMQIGKNRVRRSSQLLEVHGRRISKPEDLAGATLPAIALFRFSSNRWLDVKATLTATGEKVRFEFRDDDIGDRVVVGKVHEGPASFRCAATEGWHVKTVSGRPVGKINTARLSLRLRKGQPVTFHDFVVDDHLSGPEMILEHFINNCLLTNDENGEPLDWAVDLKDELMKEIKEMKLPPNAMDELVDLLGGPRKVAEMSGRSHRMRRKKDGTLAYVARSEELRCAPHEVNLVEQEFFQKGVKKVCLLTEVAAAGISLHSDRRQVRPGYTPPRRMFIAVELPWGADKSIQSFGRVHRANQLQPPRFKILVTPIAGEVRFTSAIARRMKLLGAVTKGDRMTSMGGGADRHMAAFDVNNNYGVRALATIYVDTSKTVSADPDLLNIYEAMPFLGDQLPATGRWPDWESFVNETKNIWRKLRMYEDMEFLKESSAVLVRGSTKESDVLNRFFNRLLMLDIEHQNALYDAFFGVYYELVRIDKANGEFDEGVENLNDWHGRRIQRVEIEKTEVLYTDPASGAETSYNVLTLDRGVDWDCVKEMFDGLPPNSSEGFYSIRQSSSGKPEYLFVKERAQVGGAGESAASKHARRRRKQYVVWRPDFGSGSRDIILDSQLSDPTYEKIGDIEQLNEVKAHWEHCYNNTESERLIRIHVITGDVLTVWRLVKNDKENPQDNDRLHIVRAITQPDGLPVVGLQVQEGDMPALRYVLTCQNEAAREKDSTPKKSLRDTTMDVAKLWTKRIREAPDRTLKCTSWFDVHKILAAEGLVPRSATGMRGVQSAVERLYKSKVLCLTKDDEMTANLDVDLEDELEQLIFPEEFVTDAAPAPRGDGLLEEWEEDLLAEADDFEDDDDGDGKEASTPSKPKADITRASLLGKRKFNMVKKTEPKTDKSSNKEKKHKDKKEKKHKSGKKDKKEKKRRKEQDGDNDDEKENDPELFEDLFGASDDDAACGKQAEEASAKLSSARFDEESAKLSSPAASPSKLREDLFGASDDETPGPEAAIQSSPKLRPPASPAKAKTANILPAQSQDSHSTLDLKDDRSDNPLRAKIQEPLVEEPAAESGKIWTYEVTGKKIGIRESPCIESNAHGDYLEEGDLFNVVERRRTGKDRRLYLKLQDGRGWAYDRSSKDEEKIIVELLQEKPC